jgi:hypothetical protein
MKAIPAYMDIDFSFAIRNTGAETILTPRLPIVSHPEPFSTTDNHEQARQTKRNFYRFLEKWGNREDLLLYAEEDEKYEEENEGED